MHRFWVIIFLVVAFAPCGASAQEEISSKWSKEIDARTNALIHGKTDNQLLQFREIHTAFGTLEAVEDVRRTLSRAVISCAKVDPDHAADLQNQWNAWEGAILPILKEGKARLEEMITLQNFAPRARVRAYLKFLRRAMAAQKGNTADIPISEATACQKLATQIDKTRDMIAQQLIETLNLDHPLQTQEEPYINDGSPLPKTISVAPNPR